MSERVPSAWKIEQALKVWHERRNSLADVTEPVTEDVILWAETDIHKVLGSLLRGADTAERMAEMAKQRAEDITIRRKRFEARALELRQTAISIMHVLGERSFEAEDIGASVMPGKYKVHVSDISLLPEKFIRTKTIVEPDKIALADWLGRGGTCEGATLSNPEPYLQIRTK